MGIRDDVLQSLRESVADGYERISGSDVARRQTPVRLWTGPRPDSLGDDCRKRRSLLVGADGTMSCLEVELVRMLRAQWDAGWVQGFPCGGRTWGGSIWKSLPDPLARINEQVQALRGQTRISTHSGHPDLAVTDGLQVAYIECKMEDHLKATQIDWFSRAFAGGIVAPDQVLVIRGGPVP